MSGIESIKHSNYFDVFKKEMNDVSEYVKALCKPENEYTDFVKNENIWQRVNEVSKILSYFILPLVITLPLYFWSQRKLEVISAAKSWHQVHIAFREKNWDNAIIHLNKLHIPIVQDELNTINSLSQYNSHRDIPFISSEAAIEASNEKDYENLIIGTAYLLSYVHLSKASEEFQKQFPNNMKLKLEDVNESVWRNVLKAACYIGRMRGGMAFRPEAFKKVDTFLKATNHL
jgi:hypothetical protein